MEGKHMKTMKRIIPFTILILAAVILFVVWFRAYVPVKSEAFHTDGSKIEFGENTAYEIGANSYGRPVFKNPSKAMKQFKKDYALGLDYMENVRGLPRFSSKYKVLNRYAWHCWQIEVVEDIENKEDIKEQLSAISEFANFYINSKMQHYNPF
jgi:hypothetical protein